MLAPYPRNFSPEEMRTKMKSSVTVALIVLLLLSMGSSVALSQDDAEPTQQQDPAMQAWIDLMTPGEHHQWLAQRVGQGAA